MKKLQKIFLILVLTLPLSGFAQTFKNPESVTFDKSTQNYYVTNSGNGKILKIDKKGNVTQFATGYVSFLGIKLHKSILYCAENKKSGADVVRGFDKENGRLIFSISIPGTKQLNDIEFDNKGNLYVTDRLGDKVFKVSIDKRTFEVIDSTIHIPNGLYFDKKMNRLLVCNTTKQCSIYAIDLKTGKKTVVAATQYPHFDGITMDKERNIYVTSWSADWKSSILFKYDGKNFTKLLENNNGMADIEYNKKTNSIDIANYFANSITHFKLKK